MRIQKNLCIEKLLISKKVLKLSLLSQVFVAVGMSVPFMAEIRVWSIWRCEIISSITTALKFWLPKIVQKNSKMFSKIFRIFRKLFVSFVLSKISPEKGRAETIRLVRKLSKSELSSRFFGRLKILIGQGSLYSLEPIFQTPHYAPCAVAVGNEARGPRCQLLSMIGMIWHDLA